MTGMSSQMTAPLAHTTASAVRIAVEGRPAPKGSRIQGVTKDGRMFTRAASRHEKPWVDAVKRATEVAMRHHPAIPAPYAIHLDILVRSPTKKSAKPWPSQHDLDKLARSTVDGLVLGGAVDDDRNVIELHARKRFTTDDEEAGAVALVATIPP